MNNSIFKSCIMSIKWMYYHLSNQYSIDSFLFFFQMFTILNNSVMSFLMHVPLYNCAAVTLNKFLEMTFMSANFSSLSTRKKKV